MQKKKKIDALFPASNFSKNFGPAVIRHFFHFFFASDFECLAQLV